MDQSVEQLGVPNPDLNSPAKRSGTQLGDAVYLAALTGLIYLIAGAFQQGYQDQFGFSYISLGIEDVIEVFRRLLIPLIVSATGALILGFFIMISRQTSREDRLTNVFIALLPATFAGVFYFWFSWSGRWNNIDKVMFLILPAYYLFDPLFWKFVFSRFRSTVFSVPLDKIFRLAQAAVASLLLILVAYNVGVLAAWSGEDQ